MKVRNLSFCVGMAVLTVSLVSCGAGKKQLTLAEQRDSLIMQGNTTVYADGYVNGCASGKHDAGDKRFSFVKDGKRFQNEDNYAAGWEHGYGNCHQESELAMKQKSKPKKAKAMSNEERKRMIWEGLKK